MSNNLLTLSDLRTQFLQNLDEAGDTGTTADLADQFLNQAHRTRLTEADWPFMRWPATESLTLVAGTQDYPLHQEFQRPIFFWNQTQSRYLSLPQLRSYNEFTPVPTDRSAAIRADLRYRQPVAVQPSAASTLRIVSSSASDVTSRTVTIRGVTATGITSETLTATGTSQVTSTNSFSRVLNVTKGGSWVGTLTLSTSGGTTLLTLGPSEAGRSYQVLHIIDLPDSADVIKYEFYRQPSPLTADGDIPDLPPPFQELIVYDALLLIAGYLTDVSSKSIQVWSDARNRLDTQLRQWALDQGVNGEPQYIRYTDDPDLPLGPRAVY